jgi:hypothetical protein
MKAERAEGRVEAFQKWSPHSGVVMQITQQIPIFQIELSNS